MTPIPKVPQPNDDLRNISGLMNLNKILKKVTCKIVVSDMKKNIDPAQFGNKKKCINPALSDQIAGQSYKCIGQKFKG